MTDLESDIDMLPGLHVFDEGVCTKCGVSVTKATQVGFPVFCN